MHPYTSINQTQPYLEQLEPMSFPLPRHKSGDAVFKATIQIVLQLLKPLKL